MRKKKRKKKKGTIQSVGRDPPLFFRDFYSRAEEWFSSEDEVLKKKKSVRGGKKEREQPLKHYLHSSRDQMVRITLFDGHQNYFSGSPNSSSHPN